ncbi:ATP-binding protein [Alloyangia pacifica]|uniref:histidine kinase n=1 Tax=Alloyangia pacifica TaxID=311180 RepID=A0A1I6PBD9_9RHOB|nr:ATP-binding protein [Alloyangia pacifica]SDG23854.1 two-component system, OmpR family, sensor histidine kinase QseC [Alloyangia pacifica]SFS37517.1 two-component system, OmpR family, sensor histidine kinase QseC [Alloyangia pacifica]
MSLRLRLFLILALATGAIWFSAVMWIEHSTRAQVTKVLDARLAEAARMVSSLLSDRRIAMAGDGSPVAIPLDPHGDYAHQLSCQIWSLRGTLVGQSEGAPAGQLTGAHGTGYSESTVGGETWRVYTVENAALGVRVMVGDSIGVRERLVSGVIEGLLLPMALILPLLAAAIWISLGKGLAPMHRLAEALRLRSPSDLAPLPVGPVPAEMRPMRSALDGLFARLSRAREAERDFTAFAAHELKTPLAGLRTQAQIARIAPDAATRTRALQNIERSVDRTDRLVRQLLELSAVEREGAAQDQLDLGQLSAEICADLAPLAEARDVMLVSDVPEGSAQPLAASGFLLHAALRNLVENAVQASPVGAKVRISCDGKVLAVEDSGPGIPEALRARACERFVRGTQGGDGSGLGLAIASAAMERLGGELRLPPSDGQGQRAELHLPRAG